MRRNLCSPARALGVTGLLLFSACSGGGDGLTSLGPVPTAVSTTVEETTTTAPAATSTTAGRVTTTTRPAAAATTSTTAKPVLVDGVPQVTATPSPAAVGARVRIEGTGFTDEMWKRSGSTLWLAEKAGCNLFARAEHTVTVSAAGRLTGDLVVPAAGACRMSDNQQEVPLRAGAYRIAFTCTACTIGELEVTTNDGRCADIGFAPNSDNMASNIVATGLSCAEAEALVRKVGPKVGALGEPSRVDVDGFTCVRTSEYQGRGLASSDFACTSGSKRVTFRRT